MIRFEEPDAQTVPDGRTLASFEPGSPTAETPAAVPVDTVERWPVESVHTVFAGAIVDVRKDIVRAASGETFPRDVVVHPGAVAILAVDDEDRVVLVHQYRHPVGRRLWEIPAGLLDVEGEDPAAAAARELAEEANLAASDWRVLADPFTSPGMTTEAIRVYLARGLSVPDGPAYVGVDEEADMPVSRVPLAELVDGVLAGRLHNPSLVTGVLAAWVARSRGGWDALRPADAPWPVWPVEPVADSG